VERELKEGEVKGREKGRGGRGQNRVENKERSQTDHNKTA